MDLAHSDFLNRLRDNPADRDGWLVYADWLDERDDPTGAFVRLSLEFTAGRVPVEPHAAHAQRLYGLAPHVHRETRDLLAEYRNRLPLRLQVCDCLKIGHEPPREMFGYARTIIIAAVLSGRLARGTWLRSECRTWRPARPVLGMEVFMKVIEHVDAGSASCPVGLFYLGHHDLATGTILVEGVPPELDAPG